MNDDTITITLDQQLACVRRELRLRRHVYPRWVENGKMSANDARHQIAAMEAVEATLVALHADEIARVTPELFR